MKTKAEETPKMAFVELYSLLLEAADIQREKGGEIDPELKSKLEKLYADRLNEVGRQIFNSEMASIQMLRSQRTLNRAGLFSGQIQPTPASPAPQNAIMINTGTDDNQPKRQRL